MPDHPNKMTAWPEIRCQRGHEDHLTATVRVELDGPTAYRDLTPIPARLATSFHMEVWDPTLYPVDGNAEGYCPAHDAVSATILTHGVWEPRETTLALTVFDSAEPDQVFIDMGAQIGWYSLLALSRDLAVIAFEADPDNARLLQVNADLMGLEKPLTVFDDRLGADHGPFETNIRVRLAKLDLEGAERDGIRILWPLIEAGLIDHLLVEVSPVFDDYYPELVVDLLDAGYFAYRLPPKHVPPIDLSDPDLFPAKLIQLGGDRDVVRMNVASWHQEDVWFRRDGAAW